MKELKLKLIRTVKNDKYTEGVLINENTNKILFDTLEDVVRDIDMSGKFDNGEFKVMNETAIPFGEYECEVTYSPKFKKDMVLIKNVDQFTGIRMHWGATIHQSSGCLLGGQRISAGRLKNTGFTKYMVDLLNKYGGKATLNIVG